MVEKKFGVLVDINNAGRAAYVLNKIRKMHPELKISKPKLVNKKLPGTSIVIGEAERGIVFKHKHTDMKDFWDDAAKKVKELKKRGVDTYNMGWLVLGR